MSWLIAGHKLTPHGVSFELHGSKTDEQGRPFTITTVLVPYEESDRDDDVDEQVADVIPDVTPEFLKEAEQAAIVEAVQLVGDGDAQRPGRGRLAAARDALNRPTVTHTGAAAAGAAILHLATLIL